MVGGVVIEGGVSTVFRQMSGLKFALQQPEDAVDLALRALSLAPGDRQNALHASELLLRTGRFDEAADIIGDALDTYQQDDVALRLLSAAQMLRGRMAEALDAIDRALAVAPDTAEYHLHRPTCCTGSAGSTKRPRRSAGRRRSIRQTPTPSVLSSRSISTPAALPTHSPSGES